MFKIIATDGKQYGPINADQLRRWMAEGRANSITLVQVEGSTDWKPLSTFPEFASQPGPTPLSQYSAPPVLAPFDERKSKLAAGLFGIFLGGFGVHRFYLGYTTIGVWQIVSNLACGVGFIWGLIEGILIIAGTTITTDAEGRPLKD